MCRTNVLQLPILSDIILWLIYQKLLKEGQSYFDNIHFISIWQLLVCIFDFVYTITTILRRRLMETINYQLTKKLLVFPPIDELSLPQLYISDSINTTTIRIYHSVVAKSTDKTRSFPASLAMVYLFSISLYLNSTVTSSNS